MTAEEIAQMELYKNTGVRINLVTIGIAISILLVFLSKSRVGDKRVKFAFIVHIIATLLTAVFECISWMTVLNSQYLMLFKISTTMEAILSWLIPVTIFYLIKTLVDYKVKFNKKFYRTLFALFIIGGLLFLIPQYRELFYSIDEENVISYNTRSMTYVYIVELVLQMSGFIYGFIYIKKLGIRDTIIVTLFSCLPVISIYLNEWWSSTVGVLVSGFTLIILYGITYQNRVSFLLKEADEQELEISDMKAKLLLSQIQPHFLYNTLNTLKYLTETNPSEASKLCDSFSGYLRSNIDAIEYNGVVSIEKEMENCKNYLEIEKARFDERVNYEFKIKTKDFNIPVLSVQTIVENAVKHGICRKAEGGKITISTSENKNYFIVTIKDNGIGFDINENKNDGKTHTGIKNVTSRLKHELNGEIEIESKIGVGTIVTIQIPKEE